MADKDDEAKWTPQKARSQFRENQSLAGAPTSGYCAGYLQTNIAILPSYLADDFSEFCRLNNAPCPVLYQSKAGQLNASVFAKDSDIRTDLTKYIVYRYDKESGAEHISDAWQLTEYPWQDMVTFYIGCSFSFEDALIQAGIPVQNAEEKKAVSMYVTNIPCIPVGRFSCPGMVVSMRPIKKDLIEKAVAITARYDAVHGAPIHIGDPSKIGIADVLKQDMGDSTHIDEGHVPVFWACGVTTSKAIKSSKPEICFSHFPGRMFFCDISTEEYFKNKPPPHGNEQPKVITLQDNPFYASVLGTNALQQINHIESLIQDDPGKRGVEHLHTVGQLVKAALRVSHASSVAIVTGFPINVGHDPPDETDGPPGALSMAKAFQALGKKVTLVSSHYNGKLMSDFVLHCVEIGILQDVVEVEQFTPGKGESIEEAAKKFLYPSGVENKPRFDVLVSIEAAGRTDKGTYKTMNNNDITECCRKTSVDELFLQAARYQGSKAAVATIGIGDGGNEIGMGNVKHKTIQHIKNGQEIACNVPVNHLITAGVSNWGGWALAMAVFILQNCLIHSRYVRHGIGEHQERCEEEVLNTVDQERKVLEWLVSRGVCDGLRLKPVMSVDGLDFDDIHANKLKTILSMNNNLNGFEVPQR
ncbi:D-glutamate cyclase, mitochondrial-like [Actinia tenebrosa]|uniref:D-glutamate cyclase, mitochondrial-like n=1 Tax=Actinia tenebrosa TaxID=6105 RepID=A0A6P8J4G5_ACTTE|nr:D-glutamate cyclase, mitochondrial-like [Actinia tenebrosa]